MDDLSWNMPMADIADHDPVSEESDDDFALNVMDDISVTFEGARPDADLRSGSNQSPVCVAGFFNDMSFENPIDRQDDDDHLGGAWDNGKIANGVSMDTDDDDEDITSLATVDDFVNFDKFDDAVSKLCHSTLGRAEEPTGMCPSHLLC